MAKRFHIAQVNIARMRAPLEDPLMADFVAQLDPVNAVADASPGFVWRFQTEGSNATSARPLPDPLILFNMSVWESVEALQEYVYRSHHAPVLRDRKRWFEKYTGAISALWWIPAGEIPSVEDGKTRLAHLDDYGETPMAFTFAKRFPAPHGDPIDYDRRTLISQTNTANGDAGGSTEFHYRQREGTIWATYEGGKVRFGTLIAIPDTAGFLDMRYQHVNQDGDIRTGVCWSAPELLPDGRVRLQEYWRWTGGDGSRGASVVEEVRR
jgi:hypothetical protein